MYFLLVILVIKSFADSATEKLFYGKIKGTASELRIVSEFTVSVPPVDVNDQPPIFVPHPSVVAGIEQMVAVPYLQYIYPPEVDAS